MKYNIVFIGVNYRTPEKTLKWVKSISIREDNALIIVVDNSEVDNATLQEELEREYSNVLYLNSGKNLGYFNGIAYAYHYMTNHKINYEWIVASNVDIELETTNLCEKLEKYKNAAIVAPGIVSIMNNVDKNPYRLQRASKTAMYIKKIAFSNWIFFNIYSKVSSIRNEKIYKRLEGNAKCEEGTKIYMPYGACLIFNKIFFERGGKVDFPLFLFGEELFVAEQCYSFGIDILYVPSIKFLNYEHASTSKLTSNFITKCNYQAIKYILKEFY